MRGEDSPEYIRRRRRLQRRKKRYMELREELMAEGEIPVEPSGAIRDERVDPSVQSEGTTGAMQAAQLVARAKRNGWSVPKEKREEYVDILDGIMASPDEPAKVKIAAFNALGMRSKDQYEEDHPKGGGHGDAPPPVVIPIQIVPCAAFDRSEPRRVEQVVDYTVVPSADPNRNDNSAADPREAGGIP